MFRMKSDMFPRQAWDKLRKMRAGPQDDTKPDHDLTYVPAPDVRTPPKGQGPFSAFLAPGHIRARAQLVTDWPSACCGSVCIPGGNRVAQCSAAPGECEKNASIAAHQKTWAGMPRRSPVSGVTAPLIDVVLLPFGATDLRVAELPTTDAGQ